MTDTNDKPLIIQPSELMKQIDEIIEVEKLTKCYNWKMRVIVKNGEDTNAIDRIEAINQEMIKRFGSFDNNKINPEENNK